LAFAAILGCVFWLLDVVAEGADLSVTGSIAGLFSVTLTNSGLFTTLVSHGLGVAIIVLAVMPRREARAQRTARDATADLPSGHVAQATGSINPTLRGP
jgi:hypothetical protein